MCEQVYISLAVQFAIYMKKKNLWNLYDFVILFGIKNLTQCGCVTIVSLPYQCLSIYKWMWKSKSQSK